MKLKLIISIITFVFPFLTFGEVGLDKCWINPNGWKLPCLLYTSDAADDLLCVDLGGRRIIKKKKP
jgi:hypothetical protein